MSRARAIACFLLIIVIPSLCWAQPAAHRRDSQNPERRTARYLESVRNQPSLLLSFLRAMPKGGDLHNHLSGSIYAEDYIRWAVEDGICVNRQSFAFASRPCDPEKSLAPASQILEEPALYQNVINALSMRFFQGPESGHDHFFNTFLKFGAVSKNHMGEMLAAVMSQAAADKVSYVEVILGLDKGVSDKLIRDENITFEGEPSGWGGLAGRLDQIRTKLMTSVVSTSLQSSLSNLNQAEMSARGVLHCGTTEQQPGCNVSVRYQFEVRRGLPPVNVFADMLIGMELAKTDARIVAINPVMPEDAYVPMHDFDLHMRMIDYLHGLYPNVHLSLHGGELWTGLVPPQGLRDHIRDSIKVGHAQRIGHGVDVMLEDDPVGLLQLMAKQKVAVEINLVSNDQILGVKGDEHPLPIYLKYGVPVTISTDDEGVSRSNMTEQYIRAARDYHLSYPVLKQIVRNSLEYSFLSGKSLWTDATYGRFAGECSSEKPGETKVNSGCKDFLEQNPKARLEWQLESDFATFEAGSCCALGAKSSVSVR